MSNKRQYGFSVVEGAVVLLVVAILAVVGYLGYSRVQDKDKAATQDTSQQEQSTTTPVAPAVEDTGDLDEAASALDATNIDAASADSDELDQELNSF